MRALIGDSDFEVELEHWKLTDFDILLTTTRMSMVISAQVSLID